ncbi:MAG: DUF402 domain-containing protein [Chloroflexota bacterium]
MTDLSWQIWQIMSLKYDHRPHYTWPATLIEDNDERLFLSSVVGGILVHHTRGFEEAQTLPSDLTFWRNRWYNVFTNYDENRLLRNFYCNVTMPLFLQANTINYVDLDLDVRVYPDGSYTLLDEDEFAEHTVQYNYPDWVQRRAYEAVDEIVALAKAGEGPFALLRL